MVIKVYISGISASQEVKKRQQRALLILDSVRVDYEPVDITEPGREEERQWVQQTCKERTNPLPPQFFNDDLYCGDYDDFNSAVDIDKVLAFLKLDSGLDESISVGENHVGAQNGKSENGRIENDKGDAEEVSLAEEKAEDGAAETEGIFGENDAGVQEVNESNRNDDREDAAAIERAEEEEELMEEEEAEEEED